MIKTTVKLLNVAMFGIVCYVYGNYQGQQVQKTVDNQVAINYAVYKALTEGQ